MEKVHIAVSVGLDTPVTLTQNTKYTYTVTYGQHVVKGLAHTDAFKEFGDCVYHSMTCAGQFD